MVVVAGERELFQVILTLHSAGGFPRALDCRQQHANQNADDGDHDQQFD
jgi:hypothetical protein